MNDKNCNVKKKEAGGGSYLHCHSLLGLYTLLVKEYQNADDATNKAETSHEAGYNKRRVQRHQHQLIAVLSVVVPVFTHRTPERDEKLYTGHR